MNSEKARMIVNSLDLTTPRTEILLKYVNDSYFPSMLQAEVDRIICSTATPDMHVDDFESFVFQSEFEAKVLREILKKAQEESLKAQLLVNLIKTKIGE